MGPSPPNLIFFQKNLKIKKEGVMWLRKHSVSLGFPRDNIVTTPTQTHGRRLHQFNEGRLPRDSAESTRTKLFKNAFPTNHPPQKRRNPHRTRPVQRQTRSLSKEEGNLQGLNGYGHRPREKKKKEDGFSFCGHRRRPRLCPTRSPEGPPRNIPLGPRTPFQRDTKALR